MPSLALAAGSAEGSGGEASAEGAAGACLAFASLATTATGLTAGAGGILASWGAAACQGATRFAGADEPQPAISTAAISAGPIKRTSTQYDPRLRSAAHGATIWSHAR